MDRFQAQRLASYRDGSGVRIWQILEETINNIQCGKANILQDVGN